MLTSISSRALVVSALMFLPGLMLAQTTSPGPNLYLQHNLVSDIPGFADNTDSHLVAPWGISSSSSSPFWVSNAGSGTTTLYTGSGSVIPLVVTIPPGSASTSTQSTPTGQVFNAGTALLLANGNPAKFIFATIDGAISGWNGGLTSTVMVDNSASHAVYTGLGIGANASGTLLYAANFAAAKIDVFDGTWKSTTVAGGFADANIPSGFAPFNIQNLGGKLFVTYGKQGATGFTAGAGNGFVDVFDMDGNMLQRLVSNGALNLPWGIAIAPAAWGAFGGALIVSNFGDGTINAFDLTTGNMLGTLEDSTAKAITIPHIWGLIFGNGGSGGDKNTLYFTAPYSNGDGKTHGIFGSLAPPAAITSILNGASNQTATSVAPGEIVLITGQTVGPSPLAKNTIPASGAVTTSLQHTSVYFNGVSAPILYASGSQTSVIVPYEVANAATSTVVMKVGSQVTSSITINISASDPGIFTLDSSGQGAAIAFNQDGSLNGATNAAAAGSVIALYATGEGQTNPPGEDGLIAGVPNSLGSITILHEPLLPVTVTIGGQKATVLYAGSSPGQPAGVMEIEAVVPANAGTGAVPVTIMVGTASSQANVTVALK